MLQFIQPHLEDKHLRSSYLDDADIFCFLTRIILMHYNRQSNRRINFKDMGLQILIHLVAFRAH